MKDSQESPLSAPPSSLIVAGLPYLNAGYNVTEFLICNRDRLSGYILVCVLLFEHQWLKLIILFTTAAKITSRVLIGYTSSRAAYCEAKGLDLLRYR